MGFSLSALTVSTVRQHHAQSGKLHQFTYLALGDSYTIGERVAPGERWPVQLAAALTKKGIRVADPVIVARTGWTTAELNAGINAAGERGEYDLVSLLIGVNNQYRQLSISVYRTEFRSLLKRSIGFAKHKPSHVLVVSIPDWGVTPFGRGRDGAKIGKEIDAFNQVAKEETLKAGAAWVDITPGSKKAATQPKLVASDGLHPSGVMYAEWAKHALPAALKILRGT